MNKLKFTLAGALLLTAGVGNAAQFTLQTVTAFPNDVFTQLLGINNSSVIAGYKGAGQTPANLVSAPNKGVVFVPPEL